MGHWKMVWQVVGTPGCPVQMENRKGRLGEEKSGKRMETRLTAPLSISAPLQ